MNPPKNRRTTFRRPTRLIFSIVAPAYVARLARPAQRTPVSRHRDEPSPEEGHASMKTVVTATFGHWRPNEHERN
eukprot:2027159-Alexandrium_andersonii.AAC.1